MDGSNIVGVFALSSAIGCHLISLNHYNVKEEWYRNKWFWAGLFGNLPALVAFLGHIYLSKKNNS